MSAPIRKSDAAANEPRSADKQVTVAVNQALHPIHNRTARHIILWLVEHQDEIPSFGHLQVDIAPAMIRARVLKSFKPVKIDG